MAYIYPRVLTLYDPIGARVHRLDFTKARVRIDPVSLSKIADQMMSEAKRQSKNPRLIGFADKIVSTRDSYNPNFALDSLLPGISIELRVKLTPDPSGSMSPFQEDWYLPPPADYEPKFKIESRLLIIIDNEHKCKCEIDLPAGSIKSEFLDTREFLPIFDRYIGFSKYDIATESRILLDACGRPAEVFTEYPLYRGDGTFYTLKVSASPNKANEKKLVMLSGLPKSEQLVRFLEQVGFGVVKTKENRGFILERSGDVIHYYSDVPEIRPFAVILSKQGSMAVDKREALGKEIQSKLETTDILDFIYSEKGDSLLQLAEDALKHRNYSSAVTKLEEAADQYGQGKSLSLKARAAATYLRSVAVIKKARLKPNHDTFQKLAILLGDKLCLDEELVRFRLNGARFVLVTGNITADYYSNPPSELPPPIIVGQENYQQYAKVAADLNHARVELLLKKFKWNEKANEQGPGFFVSGNLYLQAGLPESSASEFLTNIRLIGDWPEPALKKPGKFPGERRKNGFILLAEAYFGLSRATSKMKDGVFADFVKSRKKVLRKLNLLEIDGRAGFLNKCYGLALENYDKAIDLCIGEGRDLDARHILVKAEKCSETKGDRDRVARYLEKQLEIETKFASPAFPPHYHLAGLYKRLGDAQKASEHYNAAIEKWKLTIDREKETLPSMHPYNLERLANMFDDMANYQAGCEKHLESVGEYLKSEGTFGIVIKDLYEVLEKYKTLSVDEELIRRVREKLDVVLEQYRTRGSAARAEMGKFLDRDALSLLTIPE